MTTTGQLKAELHDGTSRSWSTDDVSLHSWGQRPTWNGRQWVQNIKLNYDWWWVSGIFAYHDRQQVFYNVVAAEAFVVRVSSSSTSLNCYGRLVALIDMLHNAWASICCRTPNDWGRWTLYFVCERWLGGDLFSNKALSYSAILV